MNPRLNSAIYSSSKKVCRQRGFTASYWRKGHSEPLFPRDPDSVYGFGISTEVGPTESAGALADILSPLSPRALGQRERVCCFTVRNEQWHHVCRIHPAESAFRSYTKM